MTNVIKIERYVEITFDCLGPFAQEWSTHGINKPSETFEEYSVRMDYHEGRRPPNFPVPAFQRSTTINPWSVVTFECEEKYCHDSRMWSFNTQDTPHMEWYR